MKNGKGKKWLAILLAVIIALPLLPLQAAFAEETAAVSEPAPVEEKPKEEKKEEKKEDPAPEPKEEVRQEAVAEEAPKATAAPEKPVEPASTPAPAPEAPPAQETQPQEPEATPTAEAPATEPAASEVPEVETTPNPENSVVPEISMEPEESAEPTPTPVPLPPSFKLLGRSKSYSNNYLDAGSLSIPGTGMPIPFIYQSSYGRAVCEIRGESKSAATSGCGAAAASMIIAYAGNYDQTPYSLFYWAAKNGRYFGDGLDYYAVRDMLSRYGIDSRMVGVSTENIISALEKNRPIIINMGPGTFTSDGHYIVLRGLDASGNVLVNDPASSARSGRAYSLGLICREAKQSIMLVAYAEPSGLEAVAPLEELPEEIEEPEVENEAEMPDLQKTTVEALISEAEAPVETVMPVEDETSPVDIPTEPEVQPAATPAAQLEPYWVEVSVDSVNLRDAAGQKGKVSATVNLGTRLQVVEEKTMNSGAVWCGVAYSGQVMYLRSDMLLPIDPGIVEEPVEVKFQPYEAQIIRDNVNLRDDAGLEGAIVATVPLGTPVQVCGQKSAADGSDWFAVVYEEQTLYVRSDMIAPQN